MRHRHEPREFSEGDLAILDMAAGLVAAQLEVDLARGSSTPSWRGAAPSAAPPTPRTQVGQAPQVGPLLDGKYWITAALGSGGQASVVLARDRLTGQLVAIKLMQDVAQAEETLLREARALASVRHPNLVALHGWGHTGDGRLYVVLDYVTGDCLDKPTRKLAAHEATAFAAKLLHELGGALSTMHGVGLLHGDVKPANVIVDRQLDRAVLIDLGLGVLVDQTARAGYALGGTPGYSAPEQFFGDTLTPAADVYGLAATIFFVLAGRGPFDAGATDSLIGAQLREQSTPLSDLRPDMPDEVSDILARALAVDPPKRQASVLELVTELGRAFGRLEGERFSLEPASCARSSGRLFRMWREQMRESVGADGEARTMAGLSRYARAVIASAKHDDAWYDADPIREYAIAATCGDTAKMEALGEGVFTRMLPQTLSRLNVTPTLPTLVRVVPDMARHLCDWLDIEVEQLEDGARLVLQMPARFAPLTCLFHRGAARSLGILLGAEGSIEEPRCYASGDLACELVIRWKLSSDFR